jgi:hypothetical protein
VKTIKSILAVILGIVLGLLPSCSRRQPSEGQPERSKEKEAASDTGKAEKQEPPKKQEDFPVRRPAPE